jgi:hypothetical protein
LYWAGSGAESERSVAQQWNDAITRLGIEPVYPPVEDIAVGDILAMITEDAASDLASEPLAGRSLKLVHLDLTAEIEKTYKQTYQFPATTARPQADGQIWAQTTAMESLFKPPTVRQSLPVVVFPAFSLQKHRSANASASGLSKLWNAAFGAAASSNQIEDVKILGAETYGISAVEAELKLFEFCNAPATALFCSEKGLRKQLSIIVGPKIYDTLKDKQTGQERPRLTVELGLINRVFLARSIETKIREDRQIAGNARTGATAAQGVEPPTPPNADTSPKSPETGTPAPNQPQEQRGPVTVKEPRSSPAISTALEDAGSFEVTIPSAIFARPVVIGFRSVRWIPQGGS